MKQTNLLKTFLLLCALVVGSTSSWAVEQVYKTLTFCNAGTTENQISSYTDSWTEVVGTTPNTFSWTIANFNNNKWGWKDGTPALYVIKCGRKQAGSPKTNTPSVATITTDAAVDEAITKVDVTLTAINANDYNSIKLYMASNAAFDADVVTVNVSPIPTAAGIMTITIPEANRAANRYYKLEFDTKGGTSSNGHTGIKKVEYYYDQASVATLDHIVLGGTYKTEFYVGDTFNHDGLTVTAVYDDTSELDVTSSATFSNPDMNTAGNKTVTVSFEDNSVTKTATYNITVNPVPSVVLTLDFATNILGLPEGSSKKTNKEVDYDFGGYTYTIGGGGSGNGYYYNTNDFYLLMGQDGSYFTFPAYPFKVKRIKVYGRDGAGASVKFNIFVGDDAICDEVTSSKVDHLFDIPSANQAIGTVYSIKTTTTNANMQITKIEIMGDGEAVEVSAAGLATFASNNKLDFTNVPDLEAYIAKEVSGAIKLTKVNKVAAGTGVLLRALNGTTAFGVPVTTADADVTTGNLFVRGTGAAVATDAGEGKTNYVLGKHEGKVGFYKAGGMTVATDKAYLQTTIAAARIDVDFDETTSLTLVNSEKSTVNNEYYNLAGQRVAQPTKGLYIVNGRKVVIK